MNSKFEISEDEMKRNERKIKNLTDVESKVEEKNISSSIKKRKSEADVIKLKRLKGLEDYEAENAREKNGSEFFDDISDDEFIVDTDHHGLTAKNKKKIHETLYSALRENQDVFSVDFDFEKYVSYSNLMVKHTDQDEDHKIITTDIPERMQLRSTPVTPATEEELSSEAKWIFTTAFLRKSISFQDAHLKPEFRTPKKGPQTVAKIKSVLDFIRNHHFEVPFIAFYRKEYVLPELNINDLWKIYYFDAEWCQINRRKEILNNLYQKMKMYQENYITQNPDAFFEDNMRLIEDEDLKQLESVQSIEELNDAYYHFMLYYGYDIPKMQEVVRKIKKKRHFKEPEDRKQEDELVEKLKSAVRSGPYSICRKAGLESLAKKFGLTPYRFAKNLSEKHRIYEVDQDPAEPGVAAVDYVGKNFETVEKVLEAAQLMVAIQLAREPLLRKSVRKIYRNTAKISVRPTKKGMKLIDENHNIFTMKYLKDKPVNDLVGDEFLKLSIAEDEKLIEITFLDQIEGNESQNYVDQMKRLFVRDENDKNAQDWNVLRVGSVELALTKMVIPDLKREMRTVLLNEAKDCVTRLCARKMFNWIKVAPYRCAFSGEIGEDWDISRGHRVMGLSYSTDPAIPAHACIVTPNGECVDHLKLPSILKKKNREAEKIDKETDLLAIKNFILDKKPHVVVVGGESREALMIAEDIKEVVQGLVKDKRFPNIRVEIIENELSLIYSKSNKGKADFEDYPELLRQAVSLARRLQDPLVEFSQLCNSDNEILSLRYHPLQEYLSREDLLKCIHQEFINRTNEVGVDIDKSMQQIYSTNLLQFVCGLGPRKARYLIKSLKQTNRRLENRPQLATYCRMGPKVIKNCVGFIKIDTNSSLDSKNKTFVEALDASRVHPEAYGWAGKMSIDALGHEDEEVNLADALEEILEKPEKLKDLDLDAFAVEFQSQGFGNKCITLYDIRAELNNRYKDLRTPYESPNPEKIFSILTKETPETFYVGKLMEATVIGINYKKPKNGQIDQGSNPLGIPVGIKVRLENGVSGYIRMENLSDKPVTNLEKKVRIGNKINCRVIKIEVEKFGCECSSKTSDLADHNNVWREPKDPYYDTETESRDNVAEDDTKKVKACQVYTRSVKHPSFQNINYQEVEKIMMTMRQGEPIIRPSSKGEDRLTVTWKVTDGVLQHIEIKEVDKESKHTLGRTLLIGNIEFGNLDQIIARYINPMAGYAADLLEFKYYKPSIMGQKDKAEKLLKNQKKENPNGIPYIVSAAKQYPGKFMLSYLPRTQVRHEYITVTSEGFKFSNHNFVRVNDLFRWFKENCKDPNPGRLTPSAPRVYNKANGLNIGAVSQKVIQKVVQNMPAEMLQSLSQAAQMPKIIGKVTPEFTKQSHFKSGQSFELPEKSFGGSGTSLANSSSRSTSPSGDGTPLYDEKQ